MFRLIIVLIALSGLASCMPEAGSHRSHHSAALTITHSLNCYEGPRIMYMRVQLPDGAGDVELATQYALTETGLETTCRLSRRVVQTDSARLPIYSGEIAGGAHPVCVSVRTTNAGHILSCATRAQMDRALNGSLQSGDSTVTLRDWRPFAEGP